MRYFLLRSQPTLILGEQPGADDDATQYYDAAGLLASFKVLDWKYTMKKNDLASEKLFFAGEELETPPPKSQAGGENGSRTKETWKRNLTC